MMAVGARTRRGDNVRIGPISIITLIAVICMAVLAVLAASTAHASLVISERQAQATAEMYVNESVAQEFVASVDDVLAGVRAKGASGEEAIDAIDASIDKVCQNAREATDREVEVTADVEGNTVTAEFTSGEMRNLTVTLSIRDNATYRIERWKATAAQQEAAPLGALWTGNEG